MPYTRRTFEPLFLVFAVIAHVSSFGSLPIANLGVNFGSLIIRILFWVPGFCSYIARIYFNCKCSFYVYLFFVDTVCGS